MIKSVFHQYKYFNYPALLLVLVASVALLFLNTGDSIIYFNNSRSDSGKSLMAIITQFGEELTYVLFFFVFLFLKFRHALLIPVVGLVATLVSFVLKKSFAHPRPRVFYRELIENGELTLLENIHTIGGYTSFPSGHTLSAFCLFGVAAFVSSKYLKNGSWQFLFFALATLVAFSRIYLFQHFLKDVTFGAFLGTCLAVLIAWCSERIFSKDDAWYQKGLIESFIRKPAPKA